MNLVARRRVPKAARPRQGWDAYNLATENLE